MYCSLVRRQTDVLLSVLLRGTTFMMWILQTMFYPAVLATCPHCAVAGTQSSSMSTSASVTDDSTRVRRHDPAIACSNRGYGSKEVLALGQAG
jgi:hypothetical protein